MVRSQPVDQPCFVVPLEKVVPFHDLRRLLSEDVISETTAIRRGNQDFSYPAGELLGLAPRRPVDFLCPKCRSTITSCYTDMQLTVHCPKCGMLAVVPDKRPPKARAASALLNRPAREAYASLLAGLLFGLLALFFWLAPTSPEKAEQRSSVRYCIVVGGTSIISGFLILRQRRKMAVQRAGLGSAQKKIGPRLNNA